MRKLLRLLFSFRILLLLSLAGLLAACATSSSPVVVRTSSLPGEVVRPLPEKLLFLPADVRVHEVFAGGMVEEVPDWSAQAKAALERSVAEQFADRGPLQVLQLPELSAAEEKLIHEYLLLYEAVAGSAYLTTNFPDYGWVHKIENFDYTLGPGLRFLQEKTGAQAALFLLGTDFISTKGRVAMMTMANLVGVAMPPGSSHLQVGVVDLQTGDLLWFRNNQVIGNRDLRKLEDARYMLGELFSGYQP